MQIRVATLRKNHGESMLVHADQDLSGLFNDKDPYALKGPVHVNLKLFNNGQVIVAQGCIKGDVEGQCSRCLEYFTLPVEATFEEEYCHREDVPEELYGNKDLNIFEGDVIDISSEIKDSILLSLPMKFVCHEDCKGMCPQCGHNLNESNCQCKGEEVDPRLAILKKLLPS